MLSGQCPRLDYTLMTVHLTDLIRSLLAKSVPVRVLCPAITDYYTSQLDPVSKEYSGSYLFIQT